MADVKKDQERDELFRRIYKIATDLVHAGHVAEWDFKSYVLGTMFYRYISENFAAYINEAFSFCPRSCSAMFSPVPIRMTT